MGSSGRPDRRPRFAPRHATEEEYRRFLSLHGGIKEKTRRIHLADRARFAEAYPNLDEWLAAPLERRVGRILRQDGPGGELSEVIVDKASYKAANRLVESATHGCRIVAGIFSLGLVAIWPRCTGTEPAGGVRDAAISEARSPRALRP